MTAERAFPTPASRPCFACGKPLGDAFTVQDFNQPADAVTFQATGTYGSAVYDSMDSREHLEVNICDVCLLAGAQAGRVLRVTTVTPRPEITEELWRAPASSESVDGEPGDAVSTLAGE